MRRTRRALVLRLAGMLAIVGLLVGMAVLWSADRASTLPDSRPTDASSGRMGGAAAGIPLDIYGARYLGKHGELWFAPCAMAADLVGSLLTQGYVPLDGFESVKDRRFCLVLTELEGG